MGIEVTPEAAAVLRRSLELAEIDVSGGGGVRLRATRALGGGSDVQVELAEAALPGEVVVEQEGLRIFVDSSVGDLYPEAILALEPQHETVVVRPATEP